jgi:hypothetical protein
MCYTGLIKRIIPFALTFAVGLFVASFFVSIALPGASWRINRRVNRFHEMQQLRIENDDLRLKLRQARTENEELRKSMADSEFVIPEVDTPSDWELDAHHPPPPPRKPKQPRTDIAQ